MTRTILYNVMVDRIFSASRRLCHNINKIMKQINI